MTTTISDRHFATNLSLDTLDVDGRTVDSIQLAEIVKQVFLLSLDGRLTLGVRGSLNALGVQLREQLRKLLAQVFEEGSATLRQANAEIRLVNADLKAATDRLDKAADTIERVGELAGTLDKLIATAGVVL